jgi:hypothetical protein
MICGPPSDDLRTMTLAEPLFSSPEPIEVTNAGANGPRAPSSDNAPPFFSVAATFVPCEGIAPVATGACTDCPRAPPSLGACWTIALSTCLVASGMLRSSRTCCSPLYQYRFNVSNVLRGVKQGGVRFKQWEAESQSEREVFVGTARITGSVDEIRSNTHDPTERKV